MAKTWMMVYIAQKHQLCATFPNALWDTLSTLTWVP